jgi:tetratricopeptide (TPR) repeat protein
MHEDVLTNLANVGDLRVVSRTSVMQYRGTTKAIRQIAGELGVAYILEGSVRRAGNTVRVTGQLIKARTDEHVWAKSYDRDLKDVFAIQSALATEIADTLKAVLTPRDKSRLQRAPTSSTAAYDLYLKAKEIARTETYPITAVARGVPLLESAVRLDPDFAFAWMELGLTQLKAYYTFDRSAARLARAKEALDAAERIDPDSGDIIAALGNYYLTKGDDPRAEEQAARLLRLFPNQAGTFWFIGNQARARGHLTEAIANFRKARALDPWNPSLINSLMRALEMRRAYPEAEALLREITPVVPTGNAYQEYQRKLLAFRAHGDSRAVETFLAGLPAEAWRSDSNAMFAFSHWAFVRGEAKEVIRLWEMSGPKWLFVYGFHDLAAGLALVVAGQPEKARPMLEKNRDQLMVQLISQPDNMTRLFDLAMTQALLGDQAGARATRQQAHNLPVAQRDIDWDDAVLFAWLGDKDQALAELARNLGAAKGSLTNNVHEARHSLFLWPLHGDPRFEALLNDPASTAPLP